MVNLGFGENVKLRSYKIVLIPFFALIVLIILFIYAATTGYGKLRSQKQIIDELERDDTTLEAKINNLKNLEAQTYPDSTEMLIRFPNDNPSLWMLGQLIRKGEESAVTLFEQTLLFDEASLENITVSTINFQVTGNKEKIFDYLLSIDNISPISTFDSVDFSESETAQQGALVSLKVCFSPLPEVLTNLNEVVNELTPLEVTTLNKLSEMELPEFSTLMPSANYELKDPFNSFQ